MLLLDGRWLRGVDEELQLDVVRIAEHDDDSTWDAVRVCDRGVLNAEFFEPWAPTFQRGAVGRREGEMVESGGGLVESLSRSVAARDESQANPRRIGKPSWRRNILRRSRRNPAAAA
jgi:hypothetical protein